jgi:predicted TPR repeat methyltransferase
MAHPEDCNLAYSYSTSAELKDYYDDIANVYNIFLESTNYVLHINVANMIGAQWGDVIGHVLDIGSGTGRLGFELSKIKPKVLIDGVDFSENMITAASYLGVYNAFFNVNLKDDISVISKKYDLLISSGVFTPNHLNANDLIRFIDLLNKNGRVFIAVKKNLFEEDDFENKLNDLVETGEIRYLMCTEVSIWDDPMYTDTAIVVSFEKNS